MGTKVTITNQGASSVSIDSQKRETIRTVGIDTSGTALKASQALNIAIYAADAANTALSGSSATPAFIQANLALSTAQSAFQSANNVAPQVAPAFNTANIALSTAQAAFNAANNAVTDFSPAFIQANLALSTAQSAFNQANTAPDIANSYATLVGASSNARAVVIGTSGNAYALATATAVGVGSNSYATSVGTSGNTYALSIATSIGTAGNSYATLVGTSANVRANSVGISGNAYATAVGTSGNAYALATATSIGTSGNAYATAIGTSGNAYALATATSIGNSGNAYALATATSIGAAGNAYANAVGTAGNTYAASVGVGANSYATAVGTAGNNYTNLAVSSANNWANTKLSISGGTIAGDLQITGNLSIVGNTNFVNTVSYIVTDPLIYIAGNNYVSDIVTIGIVANYNNGACSTVHTGLIRDPVTKQYYIFNGYDKEPGPGNNIDVNGNNFTIAVLNADIVTNNVVLNGSNLRISLASINSYTNAVAVSANAWSNTKLANTSGVVFGGDLAIKGNVVIGTGVAQTSSYALQVTGNSAITGYEVARNVHVQGGNNLLTYSEQFDNVAWSKTRTTISTNTITAPDGTLTADKLVETATTGQHLCGQSAGSQSAGSFVFSAYLKAGERFRGECTVGNAVGGANGFYASFNLNTGTATLLGQFGTGFTGVSASLINIGNGWYRFALVGTTSSTGTVAGQINLYDNSGTISYTGDGTSGLYIWGAQLEQGLVASPYTPTIASAATATSTLEVQGKANISGDLIVAGNVTLGDASTDTITLNGSTISLGNNQNIDAGTLFIDATNNEVGIGTTSPTSNLHVIGTANISSDVIIGGNTSVKGFGVAKNLHVQGGNNLLTYSEQFDNAAWTKGSVTVSADATTAPNGTTTADKIVSSVGVGEQRIYRAPGGVIGFTYTYSVYAKTSGAPWLILRDDYVGFGDTSFDLVNGVTGTVGASRTAAILSVGNGWYRCSVTVTTTSLPAGGTINFCLADVNNGRATFSGDGVKSIFLWGAQFEQGAVASPYIQTIASAASATNTLEVQGKANISGDLIVAGNVTLGDASTDTITLNGSTISLGNNQNIDAGTLFVDAVNNRVGIGTTSPLVKLDVTGSGTAIIINSDDNNGAQLQVRGVNNANNRLYIGYDTDDNVGRILAITEGVAFRNLILQDGGGNLGVGVAQPNSKLHVLGTSNITSTAMFGGNVVVGFGGTSSLGKLHLYSPGASQVFKTDESTSGYTYTQGMDDTGIYFRHNSDLRSFRWQTGANSNERMRIDTTGFIGIGTTAPAANLHVIGNTIISGDFSVGGNVTLGDASTDTITLRGSTISLGNNQNIDAGTLFIDAVNNEIGIGTTNPTSNLHVIGTANITSNTVIQGSLNISCTNASIALTTLYSPTPNTPSILFKQNTDTFRISYNPNNKLSFTGSVTGQELFSIVDSFTNVIYSITTSDGIPVVEIFNSGKTNLNQWVGNVSIGANNTTNTYLQVGNNTTLYSQSISSGGLILSLATKTAAYTLTSNDRTILANASAGGFTLTLPPANNNVGRFYTIKKVDSSANVVTITTTYSQTIDGAALMNLNAQFATLSFQSDNSNWYIV